jgi:hypothetical protein
MTSECLSQHPAVAYLFLVRSMARMGPQPPDSFRFLTPIGRRLFVFSAVLAAAAFLSLHWLGIDPQPRSFGTGRQPLYSLGIGLGFGIGSFAIGGWLLKRRGISIIDDEDERT